ncbi:MAG: hypothetical protein GY925_02970, partial [Actinomycetia bacterium]|nr:hypothetical protein [Actinomycetes bacterium]
MMTPRAPTTLSNRGDRGRSPPRQKRLFTALGALLALAPPLPGENPRQGKPRGIEFQHLTTEDGLSHNTVWDLLQDRQGFLWFATGGLLQRYDGYEFTSFQHDPDDPESVTAEKILAIFEDRQGILWLGTRNQGIDRFDPATHRFTHFLLDLDNPTRRPEGVAAAFCEDRSGTLWAGSYGGLHRFRPEDGSFTNYRHAPGDPGSIGSGEVLAILEDRHGDLWVGTGSGLDRFHRSAETFVHYRHDPDDPESLSDGGINKIYEDPSGKLWIGTDSGLDRLDPERNAFIRHSLAPSGDSIAVTALLEDRDGELWIGTAADGVFRTDRAATGRTAERRERFVHFRHDPENRRGLGSDRILGLRQDRTGIVWIAHFNGVNKYDPRRERFVKYRREDGDLAGSGVWGVTEDRAGVLWVSSHNGGLTALDRRRPRRGVISHYRHEAENPRSLLSSKTTALLADRGDDLWVGHLHGGLSRMDRQRRRVTRYAHDPRDPTSLAATTVTSLLEDRAGAVWVSFMGGGVQRYARDQDAFITYAHDAADPRSLRSNKVYALLEDRAGNLWAGTFGGFSRFDPDSGGFVHTTHQPDDRNSMSSNNVTSAHQDGNGIFWIGTISVGLNRWHRERAEFRHYRVQDGLPSDDVVGIAEDDRGRLWLATKHGLACLDPRSGQIRRYDTDDGLHHNNFFIGPAYRTSDGELFFGGAGGVTAFFPDRIEEDPIAPAVAITDFQILNRSIPLAERLAPGSVAGDPETVPHLVLGHR